MYEIYTDGSSRSNGYDNARGGYGFVILRDGQKIAEYSQQVTGATNQQMELMAAISALNYLEQYISKGFFECTLYSDSAYLINCKTQSWYKAWEANGWVTSARKPVMNQALWKQLIPYFDSGRVNFRKVKGHTGNQDWNDYVDKLATAAADGTCVNNRSEEE
jgi:ribonuclease HI